MQGNSEGWASGSYCRWRRARFMAISKKIIVAKGDGEMTDRSSHAGLLPRKFLKIFISEEQEAICN